VLIGLLMLGGGAAAGAFGSLLGLGGGILIVPLLTLGFGLPLREAVGVSLIAVIVTSSASAGVYLERHVANLRLGMTLELFTALGALAGGYIAFLLDERTLSLLFGLLLLYVAFTMARGGDAESGYDAEVDRAVPRAPPAPADAALDVAPDGHSRSRQTILDRLSGDGYRVRNLGRGMVGATGAGVASSLLGIGGGIIKVPLMHLSMGVPLRIAAATSNMMIGITAAASALIYVIHGGIDIYVAGPTAIGVFLGATAGSRFGDRVDAGHLRLLFVVVLLYTAVQMLIRVIA
jgi:uncharacterized membrane protein YfcA